MNTVNRVSCILRLPQPLITLFRLKSIQRNKMYPFAASLITGILLLTSSAFADQSLIKFSVMGDTPYSATDARKLKHQIAHLNPNSEFVIHLGDIKTGITPCVDSWYQHVANILRKSPKRLFIIPGDNEWNDCVDPPRSLGTLDPPLLALRQPMDELTSRGP